MKNFNLEFITENYLETIGIKAYLDTHNMSYEHEETEEDGCGWFFVYGITKEENDMIISILDNITDEATKRGLLQKEREVNKMKLTGIVRRVDDLGRIVIPKTVRQQLQIREGAPLEIFIDENNERIIFQKYYPDKT